MFYEQLLCAKILECKKCSLVVSLFALLRSACIKAACKTMMKLTLAINFINILCANFFVQKCYAKLFFCYISALWLFGKRISAKKASVKCWWNQPLGWECGWSQQLLWPLCNARVRSLFWGILNWVRDAFLVKRKTFIFFFFFLFFSFGQNVSSGNYVLKTFSMSQTVTKN